MVGVFSSVRKAYWHEADIQSFHKQRRLGQPCRHSWRRGMTADHAHLRALALAATPGEWSRSKAFGQLNVQNDKFMFSDSDAAFIAAANPAAVQALLDELDQARASVA